MKEFRSVLLVVVVAVLGVVEPVPGDELTPLITPLVAFLVFSSARALAVDDISSTTSLLSVLGIGVTFVLLPVIAFPIGSVLLTGAELAGVLVMVSGPSTAGSALVWTRLSESDVLLTATVTFGSILLAPLVTPVLVLQLLGSETNLAVGPLLRELVLVIGGGLLLAWLLPDRLGSERSLDRLSLAAIGVLVYVGVASSPLATVGVRSIGLVSLTVVASSAVVLGSLALLGGVTALGRPQLRSLFFAASMKNLGVAIVVAASLPIDGTVVPIVTYYVVQQLLSGVVVGYSS